MSDESEMAGSLAGDHEIASALHIGGDHLVADLLGSGEPALKRRRSDSGGGSNGVLMPSPDAIDWNHDSIKQIIFSMHRQMTVRMDQMESKLEDLHNKVKIVETKVNHMVEKASKNEVDELRRLSSSTFSRHGQAIVVGLTQTRQRPSSDSDEKGPSSTIGSNMTLITLNSEEDFPNGVWLGDENNREARVRVPVSQSDLLHIHTNCRTAEKMALTLLDYLFDRETQACSNLSGTGKHGKKQLDPLLIYGIRCHLIHRFGITDSDWHRIKLNIDSKCRTAFRRKTTAVLGMDGQPRLSGSGNVSPSSGGGGGGELQIIHATEEQLAQLQQTHQIQILQGGHVPAEILQQLQHQSLGGSGDVRLAMTSLTRGLHVIQTPSGETALAMADVGVDSGSTIQVINENGELLHIQRSHIATADDDDGATAVLTHDDSDVS